MDYVSEAPDTRNWVKPKAGKEDDDPGLEDHFSPA